MLDDSSILVRNDDPLTADVHGATVMFLAERGKYFALSEVGSRIWQLLERPIALSDLCDAICAEFDVDSETCRADVVPFLGELQEAQLVEVRS